MITVKGWCAGGKGGMSVQSMGEMGKDFCPNFLQPFLENIDRRSCNDGSRELIPRCFPRCKFKMLCDYVNLASVQADVSTLMI